jgi:DNA-binding transcriptional MerR regulator
MIAEMSGPGRVPETMTIGEFARLTRLTVKALRVYDEVGLLRPAEVDPSNGYRRYHVAQVREARLIGLLRGADVGLTDIAALLNDLETDAVLATERLNRHLEMLEGQHSSRRVLVRHIHAVLREENPPVFPIETRHVPACRVMSVQRRLFGHETAGFVAEAKTLFRDLLAGRTPTGPFTLIFHGIVDHESDGPIEAILGSPDNTDPSDTVGIRTEPAHDEAFTTITKAQWAYPAIMAAYDAVACSPEATARPRSRLSCREVYLAEPDDLDDNDLICDIAFPLGDTVE